MAHPHPTAFIVIDLESQAGAFSRFVRGWPEQRILVWLSWYGEIEGFHVPGSVLTPFYHFTSGPGLSTSFHLKGDQFVFIGDNTTWVPK